MADRVGTGEMRGAEKISVVSASGTEMRETALALEVLGVRLPARLTRPAEGGVESGIVLVPGSLFSDADGDYAWPMPMRPHVYRDLAHALAARGHAVLRFAKHGPGTGSVVTDAEAAGAHRRFRTRVDVARAALALLESAAGAPPRRVVAGHSEGGVVASLLAAETAVDGVVSLSGPALPLLDVMREQVAAMPPMSGDPAGDRALYGRLVHAIRAGEPQPPEAAANPLCAPLAAMDPASHAYLREVSEVDPMAAIARVTAPVLLVQGGRDASVRPHHADDLAAARGGLPTARAWFPDLQHFYKTVPPEMSPMAAFALETESDPAVAAAIDAWVRRLPRSPGRDDGGWR
jgi:alpha-beta hydrolase superfamily lysophospholipase